MIFRVRLQHDTSVKTSMTNRMLQLPIRSSTTRGIKNPFAPKMDLYKRMILATRFDCKCGIVCSFSTMWLLLIRHSFNNRSRSKMHIVDGAKTYIRPVCKHCVNVKCESTSLLNNYRFPFYWHFVNSRERENVILLYSCLAICLSVSTDEKDVIILHIYIHFRQNVFLIVNWY